ncbi:MAG: sulfatase-like hydrolase/transferase, partial [Pseudomonadota bacterium]
IDHAIAFIESRNQHPFFMSLWTLEPHAILAPTEEQMAPYTELTHPSVKGKFWGSETVYYASLTDIDRHVGRLIDYLESAGLRENTIIVFTSDNGPSPLWSKATGHAGAGSAGPFRGVKGSLYEGGVRVPLIVSWPRQQERGIDTQTVISAIDFLPTLATLAGIDTSEIMNDRDGEDLADALTGKSALNRSKPLFWDYRAGNWGRDIQRSPRLAIRDGDWKLLMNPDGSRVELYNLANDRSETSNIADYEVEKRDEMIAELMDWFETQVPDNSNAMPFAGQKVWRAPGDNP